MKHMIEFESESIDRERGVRTLKHARQVKLHF